MKNLQRPILRPIMVKFINWVILQAARCSDCHGAHNIYNIQNSKSSVSPENIVATCQKCHADASKKFTGYLTHATHNNKAKFPWLYYTFWAMTGLLVSVFIFFGTHTLLWLPRSIHAMRKKKEHANDVSRKSLCQTIH